MPRSSGSSICTSTIGRSPEMPCAQRAAGPPVCRLSTAADGRSARASVSADAKNEILAVLGLNAGENLFYADGAWAPGSEPASLFLVLFRKP